MTMINEIMDIIDKAPNGKRRGHGAAFRTDSTRAKWLAHGERAVGTVGIGRVMTIYSPKGARDDHSPDRILFYGRSGVLEHGEPVTDDLIDWFNAAYNRAA